MSAPQTPALFGPHCWHPECPMDVCDHSGYAEYACSRDGCPVCGSPSPYTPEAWGRQMGRWLRMTWPEQNRVREYWCAFPLVRRVDDPPVIPMWRAAARTVIGGK